MQASPHFAIEKRTGVDRRWHSDPRYRAPERRRVADRRAAEVGAHRLAPTNGHEFLSPLVVVMRIASEFAYIEADEAAGHQRIEEIIGQMESRSRRNNDALLAARLEQLEKVKDRAVHVCFGDDPGSNTGYLCAVVIPGVPLVFEYESPAHEQAVRPLLARCAKILEYAIVDGVAGDFTANLSPRADQKRAMSHA